MNMQDDSNLCAVGKGTQVEAEHTKNDGMLE